MPTWLKKKYAAEKRRSGNLSHHNDGKRRVAPRRKLKDRDRADVQARQPLVTLVLLPSGKRRFTREYPSGRTQ